MGTICRTCLRASNNLSPLFKDAILLHKIKVISSVEIVEDEDLPKNICAECIVNINRTYNFRRVIINSDLKLKLKLRERLNFLSEKDKIKENSNDEGNLLSYIDEIDTIKFEIINCDASNKQDYLVEEYGLNKQEIDEDGLNKPGIDDMVEDTLNKQESDDDINIKIKNELQETSKAQEESKSKLSSVKEKTKEEKLYKCTVCDFQTTLYYRHKNHALNHKKKICVVCGKSLSAANMSNHVSLHTAPPVICEYCGKLCKHKDALRAHLIIHTGVNRKCKTCGEWFKERASYIAHVKTHRANEDKSVICPICGKRLSVKRGLIKHLRTHTGERPYLCEFCNKGFSCSYALKTHRRQHTQEKPYKCALCPMAFPQKVSLRTHLKSKHQKGTDILQ